MDEFRILIEDLWHSFRGRADVLRGVNLTVESGGITALLGLNGAGKTTLLRTLMGMIRPRVGRVEVLGHSLGLGPPPPALLARVGYVPERPLPSERMTARELLDLLREVHPRWDSETVQRYLHIFNIPLDARCRDLSAGTKAQLALTLAMAGRPELLILDEPTLGLDPLHRHQYLQLLLEEVTGREMTILMTTHDLYQIERLADTIAVLHDGRMVVQESLDNLKDRTKRIRVGASTPTPEMADDLAGLPGVAGIDTDPGGFLLSVTNMTEELAAALRNLPDIQGIQIVDLSLEEIFLIYCGKLINGAGINDKSR